MLLNYQWFQKTAWQKEIKRLLSSGLKYELDALANKDFQYLTKKYLPRKLRETDEKAQRDRMVRLGPPAPRYQPRGLDCEAFLLWFSD